MAHYESYGATPLQHKYSCSSNAWRGFLDVGGMWRAVGAAARRADVTRHAAALLEAAPKLYDALQAASPLYLPYISHISPLYLPISPKLYEALQAAG